MYLRETNIVSIYSSFWHFVNTEPKPFFYLEIAINLILSDEFEYYENNCVSTH